MMLTSEQIAVGQDAYLESFHGHPEATIFVLWLEQYLLSMSYYEEDGDNEGEYCEPVFLSVALPYQSGNIETLIMTEMSKQINLELETEIIQSLQSAASKIIDIGSGKGLNGLWDGDGVGMPYWFNYCPGGQGIGGADGGGIGVGSLIEQRYTINYLYSTLNPVRP
jgi:hypothetical protein